MGDVGIFWICRGQLIKAAVPLVDGNDDGLFVNGPDDHASESVKNQRDQQNIPLEKSSRERAESLLHLSTIEHSPMPSDRVWSQLRRCHPWADACAMRSRL